MIPIHVHPHGMSVEEAAALPHSAILALQAMRLRKGRSIRAGGSHGTRRTRRA
jgi:hypothetical protein